MFALYCCVCGVEAATTVWRVYLFLPYVQPDTSSLGFSLRCLLGGRGPGTGSVFQMAKADRAVILKPGFQEQPLSGSSLLSGGCRSGALAIPLGQGGFHLFGWGWMCMGNAFKLTSPVALDAPEWVQSSRPQGRL